MALLRAIHDSVAGSGIIVVNLIPNRQPLILEQRTKQKLPRLILCL